MPFYNVHAVFNFVCFYMYIRVRSRRTAKDLKPYMVDQSALCQQLVLKSKNAEFFLGRAFWPAHFDFGLIEF